MNNQRLSQMADLLEEVAAGTWKPTRSSRNLDAPTTFNIGKWYGQETCGTAACAIGHAAFDARFPEFDVAWDGSLAVNGVDPDDSFLGHNIWAQVGEVMECGDRTAIHFFDSSSYLTEEKTRPEDVAARIREFLK